MVVVKVKTVWNGRVAVRGRYIRQCLQEESDLTIWHNGDAMVIPFNELFTKRTGMSAEKFGDDFGKFDPDHLHYFKWKPTAVQDRMEL